MWREKDTVEETTDKPVGNTAEDDMEIEDLGAEEAETAASEQKGASGKNAMDFMPAEEKSPEAVKAEMEAYMLEDHTGKKKVHKKWSKKRKLITAGAVLVVLLIAARTVFGGKKEILPPVTTAPLTKGDVTSVLTLNGPVSGTESADVVSNLHAEVLSIYVKEGDRVQKGQPLALIDSSDVQKSVDIAQNSYALAVSEYEENVRDTQSNYEKAVQDYNAARLSYDRNKVLFEAGDISSADFEAVENAMRDAKRTVETFTVSGGKAQPNKSYELRVKSAQYELDQKKTDLENTEVKSPIDGTVVRVNSKVGQFADKLEDDKPMFIVENLDTLEMEIAVSEYSIGKVALGQKVTISADIMGGNTAEGEVSSISPTGEEKGGGSTERVIPTTISINGGSASGLIAGITARASIVTGEAKGVLTVLQTSLIRNPDDTVSVATVEAGTNTVRMVPVKTGVESDLEAEIIPVEEGALTENMPIVINPAGLAEGMAVTVG